MDLGADAVELDVHVTVDGVAVVHHDPVIVDGGVGPSIAIASTPASRVLQATVRGELMPTLSQVLDLLGGRLTAYCELKGRGSAEAALACIAGAQGPAAVHAFDHREIRRALELAPDVPRGVLEASYPLDALHSARSVSARDLWRHRDHVDDALIREAHAAGLRVIAWTVNDAETMRRFADWAIDGICTDDVALARSVLA